MDADLTISQVLRVSDSEHKNVFMIYDFQKKLIMSSLLQHAHGGRTQPQMSTQNVLVGQLLKN